MKEKREERPAPAAAGRTVASAIAIAILEEQIRKTGELEIPGLGITLTRKDLLETELEAEPSAK